MLRTRIVRGLTTTPLRSRGVHLKVRSYMGIVPHTAAHLWDGAIRASPTYCARWEPACRPDFIRLVGQASLADVPESMLANKRVLVRVDFNVPQVRARACDEECRV